MESVEVIYYTMPHEMEKLTVNGREILYGNTWDNHGWDCFMAIIETLKMLDIEFHCEQTHLEDVE